MCQPKVQQKRMSLQYKYTPAVRNIMVKNNCSDQSRVGNAA